MYRGSVQRLPCSVLDHVFSNLQFQQRFKIFATTNPDDSEVTWYYPVGGASVDITNYVTYNYQEDNWTIGTLDRGAFIMRRPKSSTAASNSLTSDNCLYIHEFNTADGEPLNAFVASGGIGLGDGEQFAAVRRVIPDFTFRHHFGG